jgi:hypothetical protein
MLSTIRTTLTRQLHIFTYPGEHGDVVKGAPRRLISSDRQKSFELVESGSLTIIVTLSLRSGSNILHRTTQAHLQRSRVRHRPLHVSAAWLPEQSLEHLRACYTQVRLWRRKAEARGL